MLPNVGDGGGLADGFFEALLGDEGIEEAMHVGVEGNELEAALGVEADYGLGLGADAVDWVGGMGVAGGVEEADHVAEVAAG